MLPPTRAHGNGKMKRQQDTKSDAKRREENMERSEVEDQDTQERRRVNSTLNSWILINSLFACSNKIEKNWTLVEFV